MILKKSFIIILILLASFNQLHADEEHDKRFMRKFEASLDYKKGCVPISENRATLWLMDDYRFLEAMDAKKILDGLWGLPYSKKTVGIILPPETGPFSENAWAFIINFDAFGHISDLDANTLDPDAILSKMRQNLINENIKRQNENRQTIEITDWVIKPKYEKSNHRLYWAIRYSFSNEIENEIIYNIKILGRNGVLSLNTQVSEKLIGPLRNHIKNVLLFPEFNPGQKYDDFDAQKETSAVLKMSDLITEENFKEKTIKEKIMEGLASSRKFIILLFFASVYLIIKHFINSKKDA